MRVQFGAGMGYVNLKYDTKEVTIGKGKRQKTVKLRTTRLAVKMPDGKELVKTISCDNRDVFSKSQGRKTLLASLLKEDNDLAIEKAKEALYKKYSNKDTRPLVLNEQEVLTLAKTFYTFSRSDRKELYRIVCPQFNMNTPEKIAFREKQILERLQKKHKV